MTLKGYNMSIFCKTSIHSRLYFPTAAPNPKLSFHLAVCIFPPNLANELRKLKCFIKAHRCKRVSLMFNILNYRPLFLSLSLFKTQTHSLDRLTTTRLMEPTVCSWLSDEYQPVTSHPQPFSC